MGVGTETHSQGRCPRENQTFPRYLVEAHSGSHFRCTWVGGGTLLSPSELRRPWRHPVMDGRGVFCPSKGVSASQGLFAGSDPVLTASIVVSSLASGSD